MEIGIILLPEPIFQKYVCRQVQEYDSLHQNIFHISLFQMDIDADQLKVCVERLTQCIFKNLHFRINSVQPKGKNYALNLQEITSPYQFQSYVQGIINTFEPLRSNRLLQQIDINILSDLERKRIERFGIYWNLPPQQSQPYMTLLYDFKQPVDVVKLNQHFKGFTFLCPMLAIAEIGFHGNVLKILGFQNLED